MKPANLEDFGKYVAATVQHYKGKVTSYEILNEPLFTHYALQKEVGYKVADYIDMLKTAYQAAKAVDPTCIIVGGICHAPESQYTSAFIDQGGLRWCDLSNHHFYDSQAWAEAKEKTFRAQDERMKTNGLTRPIWVTEEGCYGDDDPEYTPYAIGEFGIEHTLRPSELACSRDLIQNDVVMFAHGVRKIFFHSAVMKGMHEPSLMSIPFKYDGVPRKMFAAVSVMSQMLGLDFRFVRKWDQPAKLVAYEFESRGRTVVVLWTRKTAPETLTIPSGFQAFDIMGNLIAGAELTPSDIPVYLVGKKR